MKDYNLVFRSDDHDTHSQQLMTKTEADRRA